MGEGIMFTSGSNITLYNNTNPGSFAFVPQFSFDYRLKVQKLHPDAKLPEKANSGDLGYDLFALEDTECLPGHVTKVRTGIACRFPHGYGALIRDRSSVATKQELLTVAGVIDNGYTGEIIVAFFNPGILQHSKQSDWRTARMGPGANNPEFVNDVKLVGSKIFTKGSKIAQMILTPVVTSAVVEVETLGQTERGTNGFGSSGT